MNILVITGSAHKYGTSAMLTEEFIKGATEAGHQIKRFDAAFKQVHPCIGCDHCKNTGDGCVFQDDMKDLTEDLVNADAIIFSSPIYYYDINAQIKAVIDRFYANDGRLHHNKKAVLMVTMADDAQDAADGAIASFKGMTKFLNWEIAGIVVGIDCGDVEDLKKHEYLFEAYQLGKDIEWANF
ncbi:MAG: flavodoxin family protein [Lachnospiraceae bacterium]